MDYIIPILLLLAIVLVSFIYSFTIPSIPGPTLRDYLPGGDVFNMLTDPPKLMRYFIILCQKHGPQYQMWFGIHHILATSNPADISQILSSNSFQRPASMRYVLNVVAPGSIFTLPMHLHRAAKRHMRDRFNASLLDSFHDKMGASVDELTQNLAHCVSVSGEKAQSNIVDINTHISSAAFRILIDVAFGVSLTQKQRLWLGSRVDVFLDQMIQEMIGYPFRQMASFLGIRKHLFKSRDDLKAFCERTIADRQNETPEEKEKRAPDLLDTIITIDGQTPEQMISQVIVFAAAGFHTTALLVSWAIYELACNPSVVAKVYNEIDALCANKKPTDRLLYDDVKQLTYLKYVVKETLRLHPASGFIIRRAANDTVLTGSGLAIKEGMHVVALMLAGQKSDVWTNPDRFMPDRWGPGLDEGRKAPLGSYLPFSSGPRNCPGQFLAEHEAMLLLGELYRRFEFSLACKPEQVISCTGWVETPRSASVPGGELDSGIPVRIKLRNAN